MVKKQIVINSTVFDDRVAILENGQIAEFLVEEHDKESYLGNIYLGKVNKILQGINAAFINIGMKHDGFLHFSDVDESMEKSVFTEEDDEEDNKSKKKNSSKKSSSKKNDKNNDDGSSNNDDEKLDKSTAIALRRDMPQNIKNAPIFSTKKSGDVTINIRQGQDIIVQVTREAYSTKGVKLTTKVALPGRYMVLLPFDNMMGVSQKIANYNDRKKLRAAVRGFKTEDYGCIIRTVAKNRTAKELEEDWRSLVQTWKDIEKKVAQSKPPTLLYSDLSLAKSIVRDHLTKDVERVAVDSRKLYKDLRDYLEIKSPKMKDKIEYIPGSTSIFKHFGIDKDLENVGKRQIYLPNGGSIVIDQTEAMIVIDVNSGKGTEADQEKTAYYNNMEALKEIAKQIRLRDMGGMVVIDFIDMRLESNKKKLYNEMHKELSNDRAKFVIYPLSQLGLMQITRQRVNQNINEKITKPCQTCKGTGRTPTISSVMYQLENWLKKFREASNEFKILIEVSPLLATHLAEGSVSRLTKLMFKYFLRIKLQVSHTLEYDQFRVYSIRHQKEITQGYK